VSSGSPPPRPRELERSPAPRSMPWAQQVGGVPIKPSADDPDPGPLTPRPPPCARSEADTSNRTRSRIRLCRPRHRKARLGHRYRFSVRRNADGASEPDGHWTCIDGKHVANPACGLATSRISKRAIITGIVSKAYLDRLALDHDQHHAAALGLDQPRAPPQGRPQPAA
jgi:hypothetical protein